MPIEFDFQKYNTEFGFKVTCNELLEGEPYFLDENNPDVWIKFSINIYSSVSPEQFSAGIIGEYLGMLDDIGKLVRQSPSIVSNNDDLEEGQMSTVYVDTLLVDILEGLSQEKLTQLLFHPSRYIREGVTYILQRRKDYGS